MCPPNPLQLLWWAHDHTLGDESKLLNCIVCPGSRQGCNGTLFDATFYTGGRHHWALCQGRTRHTPEGVLWLLAIELVIWFWSSDKMLATVAHRVTKAMVWNKEPIRTSYFSSLYHPSEGLYSSERWYDTSQALSLWPQMERRFPDHPLVTTTLMGGPHTNSTWTLGTLGMPNWGS